jgi:hypothetical protein
MPPRAAIYIPSINIMRYLGVARQWLRFITPQKIQFSKLFRILFPGSTSNTYEKLTQLKHLTVTPSENESVLDQLLKLTDLTSLDISWTQIARDSLRYLAKLTRLESLNIAGVRGDSAGTDWTVFASLPNLREFTDQCVNFKESGKHLLEFTRLTKLDVRVHSLSVTSLQLLTNLRELMNRENFDSDVVNLAPLENLTHLTIEGFKKISQISYPPRLKELVINSVSNTETKPPEFFDSLCDVITLERLELNSPAIFSENSQQLSPHITRLTNLRELKIYLLAPEVCRNLLHLPSLRKIHLGFFQLSKYEDTFKQMTQLVELWLRSTSGLDIPALRKLFPFAVYKVLV